MPTKPMTPKQERFCTEYLVDLNATQAAIRAGYAAANASQQGYQLLEKTLVVDHIAKLREAQEGRTLLEADDVITGLHTEATREGEGSSHSARVSAWGHLAKITGASGPKGTEDDPHHHKLTHIITDDDRQRRLDELRKHA